MNSDLDWSKARLQVIEIILNGWTALDLQIQHNPQDLACRKWLPEPISEAIMCVKLRLYFNQRQFLVMIQA